VKWTWPTPFELVFLNASIIAAESAAFAPLFGNDPNTMGATGFAWGLLIGLPFYGAHVGVRVYRRRRR
jgi:hypothetical protein